MTSATLEATAEAEIRDLLQAWARATRAKDVAAITGSCAPHVVAFDCHGPLRFQGADAYRRHLEGCLSCMEGPMRFEMHDLDVTAEGDVGFAHYLVRCGGTGPDGEEHLGWLRATVCLRRTSGTWRIVHAHASVPFDPQSGRAQLDLAP